jgi:hypothetical protein
MALFGNPEWKETDADCYQPEPEEPQVESLMTLDDAIRHCEEKGREVSGQCRANHRQLARWLKELKDWRSK